MAPSAPAEDEEVEAANAEAASREEGTELESLHAADAAAEAEAEGDTAPHTTTRVLDANQDARTRTRSSRIP